MGRNKKIELHEVIFRKKGLDSIDMDGEKVMMNIEKGKYYGFNSVGSRIWDLIEEPLTVQEVISVLLSEFKIDVKTCHDTVLKFLEGLYHEDLVSFK